MIGTLSFIKKGKKYNLGVTISKPDMPGKTQHRLGYHRRFRVGKFLTEIPIITLSLR
jgi:hypothetical protein